MDVAPSNKQDNFTRSLTDLVKPTTEEPPTVSNHLEDLTAEWLEFNGYFVRKSVLVGKRALGGFEGELDVVAFHPASKHLVHIECSLDADTWDRRQQRFTGKFERGRRYIGALFGGLHGDTAPDQIALLQFGGGARTEIGGARILWVSDFISDIVDVLETRSPDRRAVPSTFPLLRSIQLAAQPRKQRKSKGHLLAPTT